MNSITTRDEYTTAKTALRAASSAYYNADANGTTLMGDAEYDALNRAVQQAETDHLDWTGGDKASEQVAAGAAAGNVKHPTPMLSLGNVTSTDELTRWHASVARRLNSVPKFAVEPKLDGLAVAIRYEDGEPTRMLTRGDGVHGEDVTYALPNISNLPSNVHATFRGHLKNSFFGEVRGEVIFSRTQFTTANALRRAHGDMTFDNARNGVAGALRGAKSRPYAIPMTFIVYDVADPDSVPMNGDSDRTHESVMAWLTEKGFTTAASVLPQPATSDLTALTEQIAHLDSTRNALPYELDGAVVKVNSYEARRTAGAGSKTPNWATAYKYPPEVAMTVLREVTWETGRTGNVAPRAAFDPVRLGTTIAYATLNNPDDIARKNVMIGDHIMVRKAGEVIPEVVSSVPEMRDGTQTPVMVPSECPNCGRLLDRTHARLRCPSGGACAVTAQIVYAVSRDALDVEGLGKTQVANLVASETFVDVASVFETGMVERLLVVGGNVAPANAPKIVAQVERAKGAGLARVLTALGITGTGRSLSRRIAAHFGSMDAVLAADVTVMAGVDGVGTVKAAQIVSELADPAMVNVIERLRKAGVNLGAPAGEGDATVAASAGAGALDGKTVVVTGAMSGPLAGLSRTEVNELIEAHGGRASGSVSKSTSLLVVGAKAGSKKEKAEALGVPVLSEVEFAALLGVA